MGDVHVEEELSPQESLIITYKKANGDRKRSLTCFGCVLTFNKVRSFVTKSRKTNEDRTGQVDVS